jgi:predicted transcriptional regulator of viral defense system
LLIEGNKIVTSNRIRKIADELGKDYPRALSYLLEHRYLTRVFRGVFYVNDQKERESSSFERSIYEIVGDALTVKSVKHWYLGLETALRINGLTHEYFAVNFVITDSYRTTKVIEIAGARFKFLKWRREHFTFGMERKYNLVFSDREKTIVDLIYKRYLDTKDEKYAVSPLIEYKDRIDSHKIARYLENYPMRLREIVWRGL